MNNNFKSTNLMINFDCIIGINKPLIPLDR